MKKLNAKDFAIFFVANVETKNCKKFTQVSYDENYCHEFFK